MTKIIMCIFKKKGNRHYNSSRRFYEPTDYSNVRLHVDPAWEGLY